MYVFTWATAIAFPRSIFKRPSSVPVSKQKLSGGLSWVDCITPSCSTSGVRATPSMTVKIASVAASDFEGWVTCRNGLLPDAAAPSGICSTETFTPSGGCGASPPMIIGSP